jgi:hypothetical protein
MQLGIKHCNLSALGNFNMISQLTKEGIFEKPGSSPILGKRFLVDFRLLALYIFESQQTMDLI